MCYKQLKFVSVILLIYSLLYINVEAEVRITNILKDKYNGFSKNWAVDFDDHGIAYLGNEAGLLIYDGFNWDLHKLPGNLSVRSVFVNKNRIYTGAFEQFGYWEKTTTGDLKYFSLSEQLPLKTLHNDMIWKILPDDKGGILFQSFNTIYYYDGNKVENYEINFGITFLLKVGNLFIAQKNRGNLVEFKDGKFQEIKGSEVLNKSFVRFSLPLGENKYLLGSATKGLYIWEPDKGFYEWKCEAQNQIKNTELNAGFFDGSKYYLGTLDNGLYVIDQKGKVINHLCKDSGLEGNSIYDLKVDVKNRLWIALNKGISCVEFHFPLKYVTSRISHLGIVHTVELFKNKIYMGTNQGLYAAPVPTEGLFKLKLDDFKLIQELKGQVWSLKCVNDKLICGHNTGTYEIDDNNIKLINNVGGGQGFSSFNFKGEHYLLFNTFTSLILLEEGEDRSFSKTHRLRGFFEPSRNLVVDQQNNIWISHVRRKEVFRVSIEDLNVSLTKKSYGIEKGLPKNYGNKVYQFNDRIVFVTQEGLYTYDELNDTIVRYDKYDHQLSEYACPTSILKTGQNKYWFSMPPKLALFENVDKELIKTFEYSFNDPYSSFDEKNPTIEMLNDSITVFCLENGFALFNREKYNNKINKTDSIYFKNIVYSAKKLKPKNNSIDKLDKIFIPFNGNKISIEFSSNNSIKGNCKYRYKLVGYDADWTDVNKLNKINYQQLHWGEYTFIVEGEDEYGNKLFPAKQMFTIEVPLYAQTWFIIIIILISLGISFLIVKKIIKFINQKQEMLIEQKNKEWEEKQEEEKRLNNEKLIKLKNELLTKEIQHQSTELANRTIATIKRKEVLSQVKEEILKQKEHLKYSYPEKYMDRLIRMIDHSIEDEDDWKVFRSHFDKAHDNFFKRLKKQFEDLTPKDLRLCAYLKMNLSTKEIAPLMNVSPRSVEVHRYKIRKKLGLEPQDNLAEFMISF